MRKVAADSHLFLKCLECGARTLRLRISEGQMTMREIHNRLNARPSRGRLPKKFPGGIGEKIDLAIATRQQVLQGLVRQPGDVDLFSLAVDRIRQA